MNGLEPTLTLDNLSFSYGPAAPTVLRDVSLDVPARSITAILGPNGSGKTTLLHLLLGLLPPGAGRILLAGKPHNHYSRRELSHLMGLVPQDEHVTFELNVLEYVLLGRAPYLNLWELPKEKDRQIALQALKTTGLTDLWSRSVPSLSGGERQLATVARALAQEPSILLLDEPTSHLDIGNTRRVLQVLRMLRDNGQTVVFTTHDPNSAAAVADQVVLLRKGQVLAAGPIAAVLTPEHLNATYGVNVEVVQVNGRPLVVTS
jgi:iron complex transport system ATP-binding protein